MHISGDMYSQVPQKLLQSASSSATLLKPCNKRKKNTGTYEVGKEEMSFRIQKTVFWFEISVHDSLFVQCRQCEENLGNVERRDIFSEHLLCIEMVEQLSSRSVL